MCGFKAVIVAEPMFDLELSEDIVMLLNRKSAEHYDATCRQSSSQGGFLYGWLNCIEFGASCRATFRQLDLTLKLIEGFNCRTDDPVDLELMTQYREFVIKLIQESRVFNDLKVEVVS